jgi:hypothetical protein
MNVGKIRERHLQAAGRDILDQADPPPSATRAGAAAHMRLGLVVEREDPLGERQRAPASSPRRRAAPQQRAIEDVLQRRICWLIAGCVRSSARPRLMPGAHRADEAAQRRGVDIPCHKVIL